MHLGLFLILMEFTVALVTGAAYEVHFGGGTKLFVLETGHDVKSPDVKVLPPSKNECRNAKDKKAKKTLVCVASEFYPDHVTVYWQVNGVNRTKGVATDNAAQRPKEGANYKITSRLRVPAKEWFNPNNEFKCIVSFFNRTSTDYYDQINGVTALTQGTSMTREGILKISNSAKLSYGVLIVKSCLYGAFIVFLVWRLQGSTKKGK